MASPARRNWLVAGLVFIGFLPILLSTLFVVTDWEWAWYADAACLALGAVILASLAVTRRRPS